MVARPVEQVLDEVEQPRIGPLQVLEEQYGRVLLRESLEEDPPRRKQVRSVRGFVVADPEGMREPRCEPRALFGIGHVLVDRLTELREGERRRLLFDDPRASSHHL